MKITLNKLREILSEVSDSSDETVYSLIENLREKGIISESSQFGSRHSHKLDVRGRTEFYTNPDATDDDMTRWKKASILILFSVLLTSLDRKRP